MKTVFCVALATCLFAAEASQAQQPPPAGDTSNWARVTRLESGSAIVLEVRGALPVNRRFVLADDSELIAINLDHPRLPRDARDGLLEAASARPQQFRRLAEGVRFVFGNTRVAPDGIFVSDRKVAELDEVVFRIPRPDVAAILTPPRRRYSAVGAVVGGIAGGVIGYRVAQGLAFSTNKNAGVLMGVALVGLPIGGALLGAHAETGVTQRVIYRAP